MAKSVILPDVELIRHADKGTGATEVGFNFDDGEPH